MEPITRQIIPGITMITPAQDKGSAWESPNLYLVGQDPLNLIDSGYDRDSSVEAVLGALGGRRLERIIITHGHIDHAGGAWKIRERTGAEVVAHEFEAQSIKRRFPAGSLDRTIEEGERIEAGSFSIEILHFPGHTPGHLCPYIASEKIIFSADLVTGAGSTLVAPPEGNMKKYMESLRRMKTMDLDMILPGHGAPVTEPGKRVAELIEHRELREINIAKCLRSGPLTLKDLVKAMYMGLIHPSLEMAAAGTAWAHLEKLIEEGSVVSGPDNESNPFNKTYSLAPGVKLPF